MGSNRRGYPPLIERKGEMVLIYDLKRNKAVGDFLRVIRDGIKRGYTQFNLCVPNSIAFFPNVVTPIVGMIDYYKEFEGISFFYPPRQSALNIESIFSSQEYNEGASGILNRVWRFSSSKQVALLVDDIVSEFRKGAVFQKNVLNSIEWSLNEVMDNVLQHSEADAGYVMGQLHASNEQVAFTVYDCGRGMFNSLKDSEHHPRNDIDAITLAIRESVTRDKSIGQGNGLFGLHSIVQQGAGRLRISSGSGAYMYNNGNVTTFDNIPIISRGNSSTTVEVQIKYSSNVSLDNALKFHGVPYQLTNLWLETLEDDLGEIRYVIKDHAEGTGTRSSALRVRNEILNILEEKPKKVILDFTGVAVISSSFADELIAKLLIQLGLYQFNQIIKLTGLDFSQQNILHRSVVQRMLEDYSKQEQ